MMSSDTTASDRLPTISLHLANTIHVVENGQQQSKIGCRLALFQGRMTIRLLRLAQVEEYAKAYQSRPGNEHEFLLARASHRCLPNRRQPRSSGKE
jgi:hypothetical protein